MRTVELVKGIHSSALGFGCASVLGSVGAKQSRRAIECAIDYGINHFDLARSYGYGQAEEFVGKIVKGKRNRLILASKFGLKTKWYAKLLQPAKPLIRLAQVNITHHNLHKAAKHESSISDKLHYRVRLNGKGLLTSVEQSLKALKTDYLDYILIHEPLEILENVDELFSMYEILKDQGKIRSWGIAFYKSQESLHKSYLKQFDILQFNNSPGSVGYRSKVEERGIKPNIIFSPFKDGYSDIKPADKLSVLFQDFPYSVILCSTFNEEHLKQNVATLNNLLLFRFALLNASSFRSSERP